MTSAALLPGFILWLARFLGAAGVDAERLSRAAAGSPALRVWLVARLLLRAALGGHPLRQTQEPACIARLRIDGLIAWLADPAGHERRRLRPLGSRIDGRLALRRMSLVGAPRDLACLRPRPRRRPRTTRCAPSPRPRADTS